MGKKYMRVPFEVEAVKYEAGKGIEDGFKPWAEVVTQGFVSTDKLVCVKGDNDMLMCPFVTSRRGIIFIREGDYIIKEANGDKHCCGEDKFHTRYKEI